MHVVVQGLCGVSDSLPMLFVSSRSITTVLRFAFWGRGDWSLGQLGRGNQGGCAETLTACWGRLFCPGGSLCSSLLSGDGE